MRKTFEVGSMCLRCGVDRKDKSFAAFGCSSWGESYPRHLWNKEPVTCEVEEITSLRD